MDKLCGGHAEALGMDGWHACMHGRVDTIACAWTDKENKISKICTL